MTQEIIIRFLLAALWGGVVGAEREYRSKSAGFRTMIMISMGSCFFTMMSMYIGAGNSPDRIASNIVTGIGFLGAGVIFRGDNRVNGITTAATIWAVAAVGMGIGCGQYWTSACASLLILIVLTLLPYAEKMIDNWNQFKTYTVQCDYTTEQVKRIEAVFNNFKLKYNLVSQVKDGNKLTMQWSVQGHASKHRQLTDILMNDPSVNKFEC